jgi:hypothetical protein
MRTRIIGDHFVPGREGPGSVSKTSVADMTAMQGLEEMIAGGRAWIVGHPVLSLTGALLIGVVLGWGVKRR